MDLNVTITLSDRLFELLEDKLPSIRRRVEKVLTKQVGAQVREESSISVSVTATPTPPAPNTESESGSEAMAEASAETAVRAAEAAPEPEQAPAPQDDRTPAEKIREIIRRTRRRFEGDDYQDNTGSEAYKKYHRQLTGIFRHIAESLGYEKPVYIDAPEKIEAFATECDALTVDETDTIVTPPAPF